MPHISAAVNGHLRHNHLDKAGKLRDALPWKVHQFGLGLLPRREANSLESGFSKQTFGLNYG